ncbi:transglutaminase family protein [Brumimicrobium salinarum]|nr:transglutaminase family protein [Brumimicrobium salinarum]
MGDTDPMVVAHARTKLLEYGDQIIPDLEVLADDCYFKEEQLHIVTDVLNTLKFSKVKKGLIAWLNTDQKSLLEALFLVCSYQFPDLDKHEFEQQFMSIRRQCWLKTNTKQTSFEKISALNSVFFDDLNFSLANSSTCTPFDLLVNAVLDTREGRGISLGLIYSVVAQSLDIPLYGVTSLNMRVPFVLAYLDQSNLLSILNWGVHNNGVLFYVDMSLKGMIVEPQYLKEAFVKDGLPHNKGQFEPSSNSLIIKRYLTELRIAYENQINFRYKLNDIDELLEIFKAV